jgi:hypothetical protein
LKNLAIERSERAWARYIPLRAKQAKGKRMITYTGGPQHAGHGPRLWVKFEDLDTRSDTFRNLIETFAMLSTNSGYDRVWLSNDPESDARILTWEFPRLDQDEGWKYKAALVYLRGCGARNDQVDSPREFMQGFTENR